MKTLRVMIADEQPLFSRGIRTVLECQGNCVVVGETCDEHEVVEIARTEQPDIAVIDIRLISTHFLETICLLRLHVPIIGLIILSSSPNEEEFFHALRAGTAAYYTRFITTSMLVEVVRKVGEGEYLFTNDILPEPTNSSVAAIRHPQLIGRQTSASKAIGITEVDYVSHEDERVLILSSRELEILRHIADGSSNKEIAKSLKISDQTVKNHITSILRKLSVDDRTAAVVYAVRRGWIEIQKVHSSA